jgi:glycolate oxidase
VAVVEPGVVNLDVTRAAASHGLYYAPDPSSQLICTIGGNIAFNSGGAHCLKYGMTSNHVLGIKAVLPTGDVVELGGESLEGVGPDLTGFFVGCEGLFGIALEITLRLLPKPERYRTILASYASLHAAGDAVAQVVAAGLLPGALEIMDRLAIEAAEASVGAGYPRDAAALLIVEVEGEALQVEEEFARVRAVIDASGATEVRIAQDDAERARIWKGRKGAFSAVGRLSPDYIVQDGVVPRGRLGEALATIERLSKQYDIRVANVFHAGDGNLHPLILYNGREDGALERAEALAGEILHMCIGLGGSITGEHGVGMEKRQYMPAMFSETDMAAMDALRRAIDPQELANRGKMFPDAGGGVAKYTPHPLEAMGVISRV